MSIFDKVIATSGNQGSNKSLGKLNSEKGLETEEFLSKFHDPEPEDLNVDIGERGVLLKTFREPKAGSLLFKMKKGDLKGKAAGNNWESLIGDLLLVTQAKNVDIKMYALARMGLGHNKALQLAEDVFKGKNVQNIPESKIISHLYDGAIESLDNYKEFIKSQIPYHKDIIFSNARLFAKMGLGI